MAITYQIETGLSAAEYTDLLNSTTLGPRRPTDDPERIAQMLRYANLVVTARHNQQLVGASRSLTDFAYVTYLSDLAVRQDYQRQGIGKELIRQTMLAAPQAKIILLAAPAAEEYYPAIGFEARPHCFMLSSLEQLVP